MAIASSPTKDKFPLSSKKVIKKTCLSSCGCLFIFLIIFGIAAAAIASQQGNANSLGILALIFIGLMVIGLLPVYFYQRWYFNVYYYDLGDDYIVIRKGPITPKEITIPYERVQDVYMDQDIIDRMMGLYDVHLSSATISSGMEAHIDGLERPAADGLRKLLLETVSSKISKHNNPAVQTNASPEVNPPEPL